MRWEDRSYVCPDTIYFRINVTASRTRRRRDAHRTPRLDSWNASFRVRAAARRHSSSPPPFVDEYVVLYRGRSSVFSLINLEINSRPRARVGNPIQIARKARHRDARERRARGKTGDKLRVHTARDGNYVGGEFLRGMTQRRFVSTYLPTLPYREGTKAD